MSRRIWRVETQFESANSEGRSRATGNTALWHGAKAEIQIIPPSEELRDGPPVRYWRGLEYGTENKLDRNYSPQRGAASWAPSMALEWIAYFIIPASTTL